jgi:hypothetical protein
MYLINLISSNKIEPQLICIKNTIEDALNFLSEKLGKDIQSFKCEKDREYEGHEDMSDVEYFVFWIPSKKCESLFELLDDSGKSSFLELKSNNIQVCIIKTDIDGTFKRQYNEFLELYWI